MEHETFWTLLRNAGHWEFEIFVNLVIDGLICGVVWPWASKHARHHFERDKKEGLN